MNCRDFELNILSLAKSDSACRPAGRQGLLHARDCDRCAARLAEEQALAAGVREVVADLATQAAPERLEEALLAAFRQHSQAKTVGTRLALGWIGRPTRWALATAAALILAVVATIAALLYRPHRARVGTEPPPVSGTPTGPQVAGSDRTGLRGDAGGQIARAEPPSRNTESRFRKAHTSRAETTTDFFPLADEDDLESLESAQVVRVELPASALVAAGLPADLQNDGQSITADMVLGQDGLARAIRFVR